MAPSPSRRRTLLASLAFAATLLSGCAARADRFARYETPTPPLRDADTATRPERAVAAPPDVRRGAMTGRAGYASFGSRVRLRDDTPSLSRVIDAERDAAEARREAWCPSPPAGPFGGEGATGWSQPPVVETPWFAGAWVGPIGAIPPGFRPGTDLPPPLFTAHPWTDPSADTWRHRPGLSVGSGIYARHPAR